MTELIRENYDATLGFCCPECGGRNVELRDYALAALKIVAVQQVPIVSSSPDRTWAVVYECRHCFAKVWFHVPSETASMYRARITK